MKLFLSHLDRMRQTLHLQHQDEMEQQSLQFEEELDYVKDELKKSKELRSKEVITKPICNCIISSFFSAISKFLSSLMNFSASLLQS